MMARCFLYKTIWVPLPRVSRAGRKKGKNYAGLWGRFLKISVRSIRF
jgi:hypothetical protein